MGFFGNGPRESGEIDSYSVTYIGGLESYPKAKSGAIDLKICDDRFVLHPTMGTQNWFKKLTIDYSQIKSFDIAQRQVSTMEALLGGLDSRQLNQATNIHIEYKDDFGTDLVLRLGMLSGLSVMGQAAKCKELLDLLRVKGILAKFTKPQVSISQQLDIPEQIEKLAELVNKGILNKEEFELKKNELLKRI
jgi:hypothetical protein